MASPQSKFKDFVNKGENPFKYEKNVVCQHWDRIKSIVQGKETMPYEIELQSSSICNLSCKHCVGQAHKPKDVMAIHSADMVNIIEKISNMGGVERIKFSGYYGEPLMNKSATLIGMNMAIAKGFKVGLFTNGVLIDKNVAEILMDAEYVNISLDAGSFKSYENLKGQDCFSMVITNISMLDKMRKEQKSRLEITVGYILNSENYKEISQIVDLLKEKVDMIRFKVNIFNNEMTSKELDEAYNIINKMKRKHENEHFKIIKIHSRLEAERMRKPTFNRCYFLNIMGCIGCDGRPYPCDHKTYIGSHIKNLVPKRDCELCPPMGFRINQFMEFLENEYKKNPEFLDWIEKHREELCRE